MHRIRQISAAGLSSHFANAPPTGGYDQQPSPGSVRRTQPAAGLRIVVVEDEAIISMEIEALLVEMGAEIVGAASNTDQAVRLADTRRPDCLTMNISVQGKRDGVRAAIEIYERFGIRSVFVSAFGDPQTVARAQFANPIAWVSKPVSKSELGAALSAVPRHQDR